MKIGDRVYVHGHVDEIRKDTVIIRNEGGYFGTVKSEIVEAQKAEDIVSVVRCKECAKDGTTDCPMCAASYADDKIYEVIKWNYPLDYCLRGESKECGLKN